MSIPYRIIQGRGPELSGHPGRRQEGQLLCNVGEKGDRLPGEYDNALLPIPCRMQIMPKKRQIVHMTKNCGQKVIL